MSKAKSFTLAVIAILSTAGRSSGQQGGLPPVVLSGLQAYKSQGPAAAVANWLAASPAAADSTLVSSTVAALKAVQTAYGSMLGYEVLAVSPLGSHVARDYVILLYERGPLYVYFDTYRMLDKWIVTGFLFNTKPEAIVPERLREK